MTVWTSISSARPSVRFHCPDVLVHPLLPCGCSLPLDGFLPHPRAVKLRPRGRGIHPHRSGPHPCGRSKFFFCLRGSRSHPHRHLSHLCGRGKKIKIKIFIYLLLLFSVHADAHTHLCFSLVAGNANGGLI
jgi:hypothetical protein